MSNPSGWLRTLRTVRPLRPSQWYWRLRYMAERRWNRARASTLRAGFERRLPSRLERRPGFPRIDVHRADRRSSAERRAELAAGRLTLLRETRSFRGGGDWRERGDDEGNQLWTFTLHYHEWLLDLLGDAAGRDTIRGLIEEWIERTMPGTPGFNPLPWNAYGIATRLEVWAAIATELQEEGRALPRGFLESFAMQADHLSRHIEWDLRGNHLMRDARGLAVAGRFLDGRVADGWRRAADALALDQLDEQVLGDGGHFERSPMYHVHVMEDAWVVARLTDDEDARRRLSGHWLKMAGYLRWVRHPDGEIPLLNDASFGAVSHPREILAQGRVLDLELDPRLPSGGRWHGESGLAVWHGAPWSVFFDAGAVGPDEQPGHAHADTLTLECSFRGRRMVVDPGTFIYEVSDARRYDRSTAAHNTVCIDGEDSSEVWHIFRVGRRARPTLVRAHADDRTLEVEASHDGYRHLPGRPCHSRSVRTGERAPLRVLDRVRGRGSHRVSGGLLLAPEWQVQERVGGWLVSGPAGSAEIRVESSRELTLRVVRKRYHPERGKRVLTARLEWEYEGPLPLDVETILDGQP